LSDKCIIMIIMAYEDMESGEKSGGPSQSAGNDMTLQKAIDLGEYDPSYLSTFPEWNTYSRHIQFEYIRKALENRNYHLIKQWAEINNMIDFRLKPEMAEALKNIEKQLKKLQSDKEKLYFEYSK
jgi:hypothetical protein